MLLASAAVNEDRRQSTEYCLPCAARPFKYSLFSGGKPLSRYVHCDCSRSSSTSAHFSLHALMEFM